MKKKSLFHIATIMSLVMLLNIFNNVNVFAKDSNSTSTMTSDNEIMPMSGEETLPLNKWYTISTHFEVTNNNLTRIKTVKGRYLTLKFSWMIATDDAGIGGAKITVKIKDASTGKYINGLVKTSKASDKWILVPVEMKFDLGNANRKIQIFTDVSSTGEVNGKYRSAEFYNYQSHVTN